MACPPSGGYTGENLFDQVITNKKHVPHELLPPPSVTSQNYSLRNFKHNLDLPTMKTRRNCNFMRRM